MKLLVSITSTRILLKTKSKLWLVFFFYKTVMFFISETKLALVLCRVSCVKELQCHGSVDAASLRADLVLL